MGKIIKAKFEDIVPGEGGLKIPNLIDIIEFALKGNKFLPPPCRKLGSKYIPLDGRHRLIYQYIKGEKQVELFVAKDDYEIMTPRRFPHVSLEKLEENSNNIHERWYWAEITAEEFIKNGLGFEDYMFELTKQYPFLKDLKSSKRHFRDFLL